MDVQEEKVCLILQQNFPFTVNHLKAKRSLTEFIGSSVLRIPTIPVPSTFEDMLTKC